MAEVNYFELLQPMFPNRTDDQLRNIIAIVLEADPNNSFDETIENMVNLLTGDGAQGPMPSFATADPQRTESAEGDTFQNNESSDDALYEGLLDFFKDISPEYLLKFCREKPPGFSFDDAIDELSINGYEKNKIDPCTVWDQLKGALPEADPEYLQKEANRLSRLSQTDIDDFVQDAIENNQYPTMKDYVKRRKIQETADSYTDRFNVEQFLRIFPNPEVTFSKIENQEVLEDSEKNNDVQYALTFLYNKYSFMRKHTIDLLFDWKNKNLYKICEYLGRLPKQLRIQRPTQQLGQTSNIPLLQLVAYLKHRKYIKNVIKMKNEDYRKKKEEATKYGLLETCQCCFIDELIPEECFFCQKGCVFCSECIQRGAETVIGTGDLRFPCYANCDAEFSLQTLQMILPENTFKHLAQRIASEEIKKANIEGLETCPFCGFALILSESDKIIKCTNAECMMESCRDCRHKSHIPLRCNEIEYDEDVKRRTYIENKMTEALTRTCQNCQKTFIKSTGCNKMTCTCGTSMCYICGQVVRDYSHFGDGRCPLHTNDAEINLRRILENAQKAKQDLGNVEIKFDPTKDIGQYYS